MNQADLHSIGEALLRLTRTNPRRNPPDLNAVAACLGQGLHAQACLLYHPGSVHLYSYWSAALLAQHDSTDLVLSPQPHLHPERLHSRTCRCADGTVIEWGYDRQQWGKVQDDPALVSVLEVAAIALSYCRLAHQHHEQQQLQDVFTQFSKTLKETTELQDLFRLALQQMGPALQVDRCFILLLRYRNPLSRTPDPQARVLIEQQWVRDPNYQPEPAISSFGLTECAATIAAWQQAPMPYTSAESLPAEAVSVGDRWLDTQNFPQLLLMPLLGIVRAPEQSPLVLGFMGWQRQQSLPWSTDELTLLDWVSSQVSTAIIHHNTLEQVQNLVDTRTAQLKGSLDVQARLYEKTRQQVEQQRKLIALKDEFLDSVSHELRTPLTSMKVAMRMLRNPELPVDRQAKYFELLEQEWQREYDLIQNLLRLQKLESSASILPLQEFDVYEFVTQLAYPFEKRWQPRELTLELDVPPDIQINSHRDSLERIITELLTNAGKYADAKSTIRLAVESRGAWVTFHVHNIGEGISEEHQEQIFEKFFRGDGVTKQAIAGTGLGLALVKALVKHINGFVTVNSRVANADERGETCFSIRIPRNPLNLAPLT